MSNRAIIEAITKMVGLHKLDPVYYVNAEVISVDLSTRTCDCIAIDGQTEYELPGVKLMAVIDDGLLIEPVVGSTVKVIFSQNVEPFVCQFSEIENITIDAKTKISLNDGSYGGMVKVSELVTDLNHIKDDLNTLKDAFKTWIIVSGDGGAALKTLALPWSNQQISKTKVSELENNKAVHGK